MTRGRLGTAQQQDEPDGASRRTLSWALEGLGTSGAMTPALVAREVLAVIPIGHDRRRGMKRTHPERCRSSGVAEGGSAPSGVEPSRVVSWKAAMARQGVSNEGVGALNGTPGLPQVPFEGSWMSDLGTREYRIRMGLCHLPTTSRLHYVGERSYS